MSSDIAVFVTVNQSLLTQKKIKQIAGFVLHEEGVVGNISIHVIGDTRMKRLNREFRGKDKTTDVLSFAMEEGDMFPGMEPTRELGDMFISTAQIIRQAKRFSVSRKEEMTRMIVHGILHILGYDHMTKRDAKIMFPKQEAYVATCMKKSNEVIYE